MAFNLKQAGLGGMAGIIIMALINHFFLTPTVKPVIDPNLKPEVKVIPDTLAQKELDTFKKRYAYLIAHPMTIHDSIPLPAPPDTCEKWIAYYKRLTQDLLDSLDKLGLYLNPIYSFRDSSYGKWVKLGGVIGRNIAEIKYDWVEAPKTDGKDRFLLGLQLPLWEAPIVYLGLRAKENHWGIIGIKPRVKDDLFKPVITLGYEYHF